MLEIYLGKSPGYIREPRASIGRLTAPVTRALPTERSRACAGSGNARPPPREKATATTARTREPSSNQRWKPQRPKAPRRVVPQWSQYPKTEEAPLNSAYRWETD